MTRRLNSESEFFWKSVQREFEETIIAAQKKKKKSVVPRGRTAGRSYGRAVATPRPRPTRISLGMGSETAARGNWTGRAAARQPAAACRLDRPAG